MTAPTTQAQHRAEIRSLGDGQRDCARHWFDRQRRARHGFTERHRQNRTNGDAVATELGMRLDLDPHQHIAGVGAAVTGQALAFQS